MEVMEGVCEGRVSNGLHPWHYSHKCQEPRQEPRQDTHNGLHTGPDTGTDMGTDTGCDHGTGNGTDIGSITVLTNGVEEDRKGNSATCNGCTGREESKQTGNEKCVSTEAVDESLVLRFASMDLTELPSSVYQEGRAQELYLDYNDISHLPADVCSTLTCLTKLSIMGNDLESLPDQWHLMVNLQELYLNENLLKSLPPSIIKLSNLQILSIVGNQIAALPQDIGELTALQKFLSDENKLLILPTSFSSFVNLMVVELSTNCLTELPCDIGLLSNLQVLNLNANKLSSLPESFSNLPSLRELDLSENDLKFLPSKLKSAPLLTKFYADANQIRDLPPWISDMPEVIDFSIKDNKLHDRPLLDSFGTTSQKLKNLDMGGNFMLELPETLGCLSSLEHIHLGSVIDEIERRAFQNGNWLYQLPRNFGQLTLLREAHLDENQLAELPDSFGDLVNLEWLDLGQNLLKKLPNSFCQLSKLSFCQLSKNQLKVLPVNIGQLSSLVDLRLDNNVLSELPESMKDLKTLKSLDLFNNQLIKIPDCIQYLENLEKLDIEENRFRVKLDEVPQIVFTPKYAARDKDKESWRGKSRIDNLAEANIVKIETDNPKDDSDPEEEPHFSQHVMERAIECNMSLWRTHTGPHKRQVYVRNTSAPVHEQFASFDDEEMEMEDDDWDPPKDVGSVVSWETSQNLSSGTGNEHPIKSVADELFLETEEDWGEELENQQNPYDACVDYAPAVEPVSPLDSQDPNHIFIPAVIHVQRHLRHRDPVGILEGQFDDADD